MFIPVGFPNSPYFIQFQEDYGAPFHSVAPVAFWIQNFDGKGNKIYITALYDSATKSAPHVWESGTDITGKWLRFLVNRKLSTSKTGFLQVWYNKAPVTFKSGLQRITNIQTMLTGATSANTGLIHYRAHGSIKGSATLYFDHLRLGTTRAAVEL